MKNKTSLGYFFVVNKSTCGSCKPLLVSERTKLKYLAYENLCNLPHETEMFSTHYGWQSLLVDLLQRESACNIIHMSDDCKVNHCQGLE